MYKTTESNELIVIDPKQFGLNEVKANEIKNGLTTIIKERTILSEKYMEVVQMDIDSPDTSKIARELRLKIKENRTKGIEAWHKVNKEFYLRGGQFVDAIKKKEVAENERMEDALSQIENHFAIKLKEKQDALHLERLELIKEYVEDTTALDFRTMEQDVFDAYLTAKKNTYETKIKEERKAEEERLEFERLQKQRNEREIILLQINGVKRNQNHTFTLECLDFKDASHLIDVKEILDCEESKFLSYLEEFKSTEKSNSDFLEKQRLENERLKKETEAREKLIEKRSKLMMPYIQFIRDFKGMLNLEEDKFTELFNEIKKEAEAHWEFERTEQLRKQKEADDLAKKQAKEKADADAKLKKEQEEKARLQKELDAKKEAEAKELKEKTEAEAKVKKEAEKLAKSPIKNQLNIWVDGFSIDLPRSELLNNDTALLIKDKFESFKKWAKQEVEKI